MASSSAGDSGEAADFETPGGGCSRVQGRPRRYAEQQGMRTRRIRLNNDVYDRWLALKTRGHFRSDNELARCVYSHVGRCNYVHVVR